MTAILRSLESSIYKYIPNPVPADDPHQPSSRIGRRFLAPEEKVNLLQEVQLKHNRAGYSSCS